MSANPFLDAINSAPDPMGGNFQDTLNQSYGSIPSPHGVDLSQYAPVTSNFNFTPSGFMPKSSVPVPGSTPAANGGNNSGGGFWDSVGNALGDAWNHVQGAWNGYWSTNDFKTGLTQTPLSAAWKGFLDPNWASQANQKSEQDNLQSIQEQNIPQWVKNVESFDSRVGNAVVSDPVSAIPVGAISDVLRVPEALRAATAFTGKGVGKGYDATIGALSKLPKVGNVISKAPDATTIANTSKNALRTAFQTIPNTRDYFKNSVSKFFGGTSSVANKINTQLTNIFKGVPLATRQALLHGLESTAPGTAFADPTLEGLRQQVEPLLNEATQMAKSKGLIDSTMDPATFGVGRYIPHIRVDKLDTEGIPMFEGRYLKPSLDASKERTIPGTISDINANPDLPNFENDALKVLGYHLHQLNTASGIKDLIDTAMSKGVKVDDGYKVAKGEMFPGTDLPAATYTHDGETVLLPKGEADYLNGIGNQKEGAWSKVYRGFVNGANRVMFMTNPLMHVGNNLLWQTFAHTPGTFAKIFKNPGWFKEAFGGIKPGSAMDEALKNGALHLTTEIGAKGNTAKRVGELAKAVDAPESRVANTFRKIAQGMSNFTPNVEKVYRTGAFQHALDKGKTAEDASNFVRSIYGGHIAPNTMSAAERTLSSVMPFFNWTKTAIGSNVKNAMYKPWVYSGLFHGMDQANRMTTGHSMWDNKNPFSIGLPETNAQGLQEFWAPYNPAIDAAKFLRDLVTQGPSGALDYGFSRANPLVKGAANIATHEQNPFAPENQKYNVDPYPALPSQYNRRGIFFGDKGPQAPAMVAQLLQNFSNPFGDIAEMQGQGPLATGMTNPFIGLGGTISAPNPASAIKEQNYNNREMASEFKSWLKKHAGGQ